MSRTIVIIFLLFISSKCNSCCLPYTMDLASDARHYHAELKELVGNIHPLDDKIRTYILAGYHLFEEAETDDYDSIFQIVVYMFKDLKAFNPSRLNAVVDGTPHHIALNAAIYRKVKDAFICVMNDSFSGGRKRSHEEAKGEELSR